MTARGRKNHFYKGGGCSGWREYRYGEQDARKKRHKRILSGDRREHRLIEIVDFLKGGRSTVFEFEGYCRAGLRSAFCLLGYDWDRSDAEAAELIERAFRRIGVDRPTWQQGQREYTVAREDCSWCGRVVPAELLKDGLSIKFCSDVCARSAYQWRDHGERRNASELSNAARNIILRVQNPLARCANCGDEFRSTRASSIYCSQVCGAKANRRLEGIACDQCGVSFRPRRATTRFCSIVCKEASKSTVELPATCVSCGGGFTAKMKNRETCSKYCQARLYRMRQGKFPIILDPPAFDFVFTFPVNAAPRRLTTARLDLLLAAE